MMIALMAVYLVLLFALVRFGIVSFNLFWKCSPFIVLLLGVVANMFNILQVDSFFQQLILGLVVLITVATYRTGKQT